MRKKSMRATALVLTACLLASLLSGCGKNATENTVSGEHEPLSVVTTGANEKFKALLAERYPEVKLELVSYAGGNATGYCQYQLERGKVPDIYNTSIFGMQEEQREYLLDLSGYEFLNNYKTADINQVALDGAVYLVPASMNIIGIYYNKTMFEEHGWAVPANLEELKALCLEIKAAGIDPVAAQFELPGNGFFDLFTLAKTDFLATPAGIQWEQEFKAGKATAAEGLSGAAEVLQELIDCGFYTVEDTQRRQADTRDRFFNGETAMYVSASMIQKFCQNEDGTGDQYGIMPYFGAGEDSFVLISQPMRYYGLSKELGEPGNEQKLEDALKVMSLMATEEGQYSLPMRVDDYVTPLKNSAIPEDSPFHEVEEVLQNGHTSNLAYAGYEPIIVGVGEKARDWVAGKCTGEDVLALMDQLQTEYLAAGKEPAVAVAETDFTLEESAQLQAEALREAAGTDIGMVSLGGYDNGIENKSGVCGLIFYGDLNKGVVNAIVPGIYTDPVCILTLSGADLKGMLETGFVVQGGENAEQASFSYIPAGITVSKNADGKIKEILLPDGTALDETGSYTVAIDEGGFTEETGEAGKVQTTDLVVVDVISKYFSAHSPLSPLEPSLK